jgi:hypothetical protein
MTALAGPFHVIASTDGADPCSRVCSRRLFAAEPVSASAPRARARHEGCLIGRDAPPSAAGCDAARPRVADDPHAGELLRQALPGTPISSPACRPRWKH